jgi:hypothetical protein
VDAETELLDSALRSRDCPARIACGAALMLVPIALWCLTHRYRGLVGDSELYAVQALSRANPGLARDVFLSHASQDRYTMFSPIYAFFIQTLGLRTAAVALLVCFKLCFYGASWVFSRTLFDSRTALLTTALLIVVPVEYGAYHVFRVAEDMMTARSMAEALAMTGLCLHVLGRRTAGLALAAFALTIHALMALPMVLLLVALRLSIRTSVLCAMAIVAVALCAASAAVMAPHWTPSFLGVIDPSWLEVVRERSQFVFLDLWRLEDWESNARPFVSLALSLMVILDARVRKLCVAAMIVGVTGIGVSLIASLGPSALLLQGQAWRWTWVTGLASLLVLIPTVLRMRRAQPCGSLCAVLLLAGWLVPVLDGPYCAAAALCLWCGRRHILPALAPYLRIAAAVIGVLVLARALGTGWTALTAPLADPAHEIKTVLIARALLGLDCVGFVLTCLLGWWILRSRSLALPAAIAAALGAVMAFAAPGALADPGIEGSAAQIEAFSDWRAAIPPGDNVLVVPMYYTAAFSWFTLQRPSYLTVDQSSGVIFSRAVAAEIRRRSEVLRPIEEPDWRLLSRRKAHEGKVDAAALPLTRARLAQICSDPQLKFVVAREDVGFERLHHEQPGASNGWNLYDCERVKSAADRAAGDVN